MKQLNAQYQDLTDQIMSAQAVLDSLKAQRQTVGSQIWTLKGQQAEAQYTKAISKPTEVGAAIIRQIFGPHCIKIMAGIFSAGSLPKTNTPV